MKRQSGLLLLPWSIYHVEKPPRLVCGPVRVSATGHALLVDNVVEALIDEIRYSLITPNKPEAEPIPLHRQKVQIPLRLARKNSKKLQGSPRQLHTEPHRMDIWFKAMPSS